MAVEAFKGNELERNINRLFLAFPGSGACKNPRERLETYTAALSRIPLSFVSEACDYAIKGKLGGGSYPPSATDLYQLAAELQARAIRNGHGRPKFSWEKEEIYHNTSPAERARVVEGFKQLLSDIRNRREIYPEAITASVFRLPYREE